MLIKRWGSACIAVPCVLSGCDLSEVEIPEGEPMVIVQAVLRPDLDHQYVVLEESFVGTVTYEVEVDASIPTEGAPKTPLEGALVTVANLDLPSDSCGSPVMFLPDPPTSSLPMLAGVYWGPTSCPTMTAGDILELRVETPDGDVVTGTTRLPGMTGAAYSVGGDSLPFGTDNVTMFNRDRDTLRVWVEAMEGRLLQLQTRRSGMLTIMGTEAIEPGAKIFADTTAVSVPGDVTDVFARGAGDDVFRAGRDYVLTAALADTNYFDFARSRNNEFTGRGFINRLTGGIGVFGSLVATSTPLKVTGEFDDEREGVYRLQGQVQGIDVDAELTLYLARSVEDAEFSAFLDGDWVTTAEGAGGAVVWDSLQLESKSVDGAFQGQSLFVVIYVPAFRGSTMRQVLRGIRLGGAPFRVTMADSAGIRLIPLGTLTATQR
jgi:hypothetical protein